MESLQEIDDTQNDNEVTAKDDESMAQKIKKRSPINKMLFKVGGGVLICVALYLFGSSKYNEYQKNQSSQVISESSNVASDTLDENSDSDIIDSEEHVSNAKKAIAQQREKALARGENDNSSSVSDIKTSDDFFDTTLNNSIEGQNTGGQSFSISNDFNQFIGDNLREFNVNTDKKEDKKAPPAVNGKNNNDVTESKKSSTDKPSEKYADIPSLTKGIADLGAIRETAIATVVSGANTERTPHSGASRSSKESASESSNDNNSKKQYLANNSSTQGPRFPQGSNSESKRSKYQLLDNITSPSNQARTPYLAQSNNNQQQGSSGIVGNNINSGGAYNQQATSKAKSINGGRGLFLGEKMLAETQHSIISTSETMFLLVEIIQGPLTGAKIVYKPTLNYDTFAFQSSVIQYKGNQSPFSSIIITPDEALSSGYRSGVDYHTLMNLGMVFLSGVAKGSAEFINEVADEIVIGDNQVITSVEFSTEKLLWAAFGGVADAATPLLEKQLNKPPTVWIDAYDLVGIMMMDNWNAEWSPKIDDNSAGVF